ncbi:MAG: polysaccharide biosynthesis/export family protein [Acidobacteria bacterium]|nr:polysaccharide biosynthesis/export family protein [Acidobacteriota bacterium]
MLKRSVFWIAIWSVSTTLSWGQGLGQQNRNWNEQIQQLSFLDRSSSEYRLGAGDLIEVSVFGVEDFNYNLRIDSLGQINLPFIGSITAAGLTPTELGHELKSTLEGRLIRNPQVSVFVKEYRSQPVFVLGAVKQPGQYQMIYQLNLIDVIAMAGGLEIERAADYALVRRRGSGRASEGITGGRTDGEAVELAELDVVEVDLKELLEGSNLSLNIPIQGGDVIYIPERKMELFYVVGEVTKPGAFEIPPQNDVFVSQAVTWAGGPMKTAKTDKGILVRYNGNGERQEMAVNFSDIIQGKKSDFLVQANDIIFIPGSTAKSLGYGLLQIIPATLSGSIIWGAIR